MSEQETDALLQALPPLSSSSESAEADVDTDTPAPSPDQPLEPAFPTTNDQTPSDSPAAPTLVRYAPEGEVERAALISLTFSEPMVPITRLGQTLEKEIPVTLNPAVEGQWRWMDTHSLVFEPTGDALPMATDYTVTLEDGFTSAAGLPLASSAQWQFATAPLEVTNFYPGDNAVTDQQPILILVFNQAIDESELLKQLALKGGQQDYSLEPVDPAALKQDSIKQFIEDLPAEHWLALSPAAALPWDQSFSLTLAQGAPAKTGNRLSKTASHYSFRSAGPLRFKSNHCAEHECTPEDRIPLQLSHGLSEDWDKSQFRVAPEVNGLEISHYGNHIHLTGQFQPDTEYTLTLPGGTKDEFGRVLEKDLVARVTIAPYPPEFSFPGHDIITLPGAFATLPLVSRNVQELKIELRQVTPSDWPDFQKYRHHNRRRLDQTPPDKPGKLLEQRTLELNTEPNKMTVTRLSLDKGLNEEGFGHLVIFASSPEMEREKNSPYRHNFAQHGQWLQVTNLGVSTYSEKERLTAWVTGLDSGNPIQNAKVQFENTAATTDARGLATLNIQSQVDNPFLIISEGTDRALFTPHTLYSAYGNEDNYYRYPMFTFTDRQLYQPGETVNLKGIIRELPFAVDGDIQYPTDLTHLEWTAYDGQRNELGQGRLPLSDTGAFDLSLPLPKSAASGSAGFELRLFRGDSEVDHFYGAHSFAIETFRRPEYKVDVNMDAERYLPGTPLQATAQAQYYSGGPLPNAPVDWELTLNTTRYAPPGWTDYHFGRVPPMWGRGFWPAPEETRWQHGFSGETNADGEHSLNIAPNSDLDFTGLLFPHQLKVATNITDVNRQQWSSQGEVLVHPAEHYVGLRTDTRFAEMDDTVTVQWISVDIDGNKVDAEPEIEVEQLAWEDGAWQAKDGLACAPTNEDNRCEFSPTEGGQYRISATLSDSQGRESQSQIHLWVSGDSSFSRPSPDDQPRVQLIPDQDEYAPGDTARIQVQAPFAPAQVLVTVQRQGLAKVEHHYLETGTYTLELPIKSHHLPQLRITAEAWRTL